MTDAPNAKPNAPAPVELTRSDEGTLHGQIYRALVDRINRGEVKPGDRMPTEAEVMEIYSVSRSTARRALDELRRANFVERQPGKGTFVTMPKLHATIPYLHSITEEIEQLGFRPGSKLIAMRLGQADAELAGQLALAPNDAVLFLERLRTANDRPFYFAVSALNVTAFPKLKQADFSPPSLSLYRLFEEVAGRPVRRVTQWLSAVGATREVARHLAVRPGSPLLQLERVLYVAGDRPIEMVRAWFVGGSYKYYSELAATTDRESGGAGP
jgi:GntR family transcriptional regulator